MTTQRLSRLTPVAAALAALVAAPAFAQQKESDNAGLEKVVVTATSQAKSKMRSSVSVTDVDQDTIKDLGARTEAEVLLLIPGIRTEATAGPGGNANITVRGLPISSGGSKYVQLQEDGLPTVQFGDMNFGNNDYWIRFDNNVDNVQTLRGGSSSVFASHAPGAVINYISKTGKQTGGSVGITSGLNYNEKRFDGDYGDKLGAGLYYHVGGYYRVGEGARHTTPNSLEGYQLKGNITKEFNGGKGYFRVNFKLLDEHAPTTPQTFLAATQSGNYIGGFKKVPGYDGTRDSQYSRFNSTMTSVNPATGEIYTSSLTDGITVKSQSVGFEFHNELNNGWTIDNKFRKSNNSGAFQAQFWDIKSLSSMLSDFGAGSTARYFNGPLAGQTVTTSNLQAAGLVSAGAAINTQNRDIGNIVNDLSVSKTFKTGNVTVDARGGLFYSVQNVNQLWSISNRIVEVGKNGAVIDVFNSAGAALTTAGMTGYNNQWGACCARDIDAKFTTTAPYLGLNAAAGQFDFDAGVRRESFRSDAVYAGPKKAPYSIDVDGNGQLSAAEQNIFIADTTKPGYSDYKVNYTNFSFGVNYRVNNDLSVFGRTSKGYRAIADRLLFSANINAVTGALASPQARDAALAPVKQSELGVKYRGKANFGSYGLAATVFKSTTNEFDYDQTRQDDPTKPNFAGPKLNQLGFKSNGFELEGGFSMGAFSLNGNVVHSKEELTSSFDKNAIGKTSGGVPKLRYNIVPRYTFGDLTIGGVLRGQGEVFADGSNTTKIKGHDIINAFANYDFGNGLVAAVNVNNLFNKVFPASGAGFIAPGIVGAGVETGRTMNASVRYNF